MEDWRYENLREDVKRLREELYEVRGADEQSRELAEPPAFSRLGGISWLMIIGIWIAVIVDATGALDR